MKNKAQAFTPVKQYALLRATPNMGLVNEQE